jgi:anaerobic magnesium-protoporphyrin IX monomethyl ester cyclase
MILLTYPAPQQTSPNKHPALSIFYVGAYLEKLGYDVEYWDARHDRYERLIHLIERASVVGVSSLSGYQLKGAIDILRLAHNKGRLTVFGGTHPSLLPAESMEPYVDFVVRFEGELTMAALMDAIENGGRYEEVKGLVWRDDIRDVHVNPPRKDADLGTLPSPITKKTLRYFLLSESPMIQTARGCPHTCGFCYLASQKQSKWRPVPLDMVERDLDILRSEGVSLENLLLAGDWNGPAERVTALARLLGSKGATYSLNMRADDITPTFASEVSRLGVKTLQIGLESGSPRILRDIVRKHENVYDYVRCAEALAAAGLKAEYFVMRGLPTETHDDREATCALVDWLYYVHGGRCSISCFWYVPLPGTPLYAYALNGPKTLEEWSSYSRDSSHPEAQAWYWVAGLTFNAERGGKTDKNFPGHRRLLIAWLEQLFSLRWRLRFFRGFALEGAILKQIMRFSKART